MVRLKKGMAWVLCALCIFTMSQVPGMAVHAEGTFSLNKNAITMYLGSDTEETLVITHKESGHSMCCNGIDSCDITTHTMNGTTETVKFKLNDNASACGKMLRIACSSCSAEATLSFTISDSAPAPDKKSSSATTVTSNASSVASVPHNHNFSWVTVQEVTTSQDGIEEYRCDCGMVDERSIIPSSQVYVKGLYGAIKNAPENGEVTYDTGKISTISDYIIKKLQERSDVKTVINFEYKNVKYKMTIPAGADYTKLLEDQDYFYGYFFFANEVGAAIEGL